MPVGASLFISLIAAFGFFATLFGLVILIVEGRRAKSSPKMGIAPGGNKGLLDVWVNWDPSQFNVEVYRLRFQHITPNAALKEGTFTVTFDNAQVEPFIQTVELPQSLKNLIDSGERGLLTVDFKTVHETTLQKVYSFAKLRKILSEGAKIPAIKNKLATAKEDVASVFSLDFEELQERRKKLKTLEDAAKAKAAKAAAAAAAKPAAAPAAAPAPSPAPAKAAAANAPGPQGAAAAPADKPATAKADAAAPAKSVREVVSQANAKPAEKPVGK